LAPASSAGRDAAGKFERAAGWLAGARRYKYAVGGADGSTRRTAASNSPQPTAAQIMKQQRARATAALAALMMALGLLAVGADA
jgi:hypothetical protein